MTNFRFLANEFKLLFEHSRDAEELDGPERRALRICSHYMLNRFRPHTRDRDLRVAHEKGQGVLLIQSRSSCLMFHNLLGIIRFRDIELPATSLESVPIA